MFQKTVNQQDAGDETASDIRLKVAEIRLAPLAVHSAVDICRFLSETIKQNVKKIQECESFLRNSSIAINGG